MSRLRVLVVLLCVMLASCAAKPPAEQPVSDPSPTLQQDVRLLREHLKGRGNGFLCGNGHEEDLKRMNGFEEGFCEVTLGENRTLAACEVVLTNPTDAAETALVLDLLSRRKGDRSRFVEPAVAALKHPEESVRASAAVL